VSWPIDPEIRRASTLPASYYRDVEAFEASRDRIFAKSWQPVGDLDRVKTPGSALPVTLLPGFLDEPLLLTRDGDDRVHVVSNVCTHRGTILCEGETHGNSLRCRYHGRRFGLDGKFLSMPGFEGCDSFPTEKDNLARVPSGVWGRLLFASLQPSQPFEKFTAEMQHRVGFLPLDRLRFDPALSRDYLVSAHWALYCDNYLEGFHVPFVHPSLAAVLDANDYRTEIFDRANLQIGVAASPGDAFALPPGHPDAGTLVAAWYFWLFPNLMFNFYPWGLSVNVVTPLAPDRTRVSFLSYVLDPSRLATGAGAGLDRVEREDESVVEAVQKGMKSRFYVRGRYSPRWERGVHHFHRLLVEALG
jgi:choline monooxygenase